MSGYLVGIVSTQRAAAAVRPRPSLRFGASDPGGGVGLDVEVNLAAAGGGSRGGEAGAAPAGRLIPAAGRTGASAGDAGHDHRPGVTPPVPHTAIPSTVRGDVPAAAAVAPSAAGRPAAARGGGGAEIIPAPRPPLSRLSTPSKESLDNEEPARSAPPPVTAPPGAADTTSPRPPPRHPVGFKESTDRPSLVAPRPPVGVRRDGESAAAGRGQVPGAGGAPEPIVHVTIGRIEIRATTPASAPGHREPPRRHGVMSLDDYSAQRGSGR